MAPHNDRRPILRSPITLTLPLQAGSGQLQFLDTPIRSLKESRSMCQILRTGNLINCRYDPETGAVSVRTDLHTVNAGWLRFVVPSNNILSPLIASAVRQATGLPRDPEPS